MGWFFINIVLLLRHPALRSTLLFAVLMAHGGGGMTKRKSLFDGDGMGPPLKLVVIPTAVAVVTFVVAMVAFFLR